MIVKNKYILKELKLSKENNEMTEFLQEMMLDIIDKNIKSRHFQFHHLEEDMRQEAWRWLIQNYKQFDETKSSNPHAYFSQLVRSAFMHASHKEKQQQSIYQSKINWHINEGEN